MSVPLKPAALSADERADDEAPIGVELQELLFTLRIIGLQQARMLRAIQP